MSQVRTRLDLSTPESETAGIANRPDRVTALLRNRAMVGRPSRGRWVHAMRLKDETANSYGRLKVIRRDGTRSGNALWLCQCSCGLTVTVSGRALRSGKTGSCGCLRSDKMRIWIATARTYRSFTKCPWCGKNSRDPKGCFRCRLTRSRRPFFTCPICGRKCLDREGCSKCLQLGSVYRCPVCGRPINQVKGIHIKCARYRTQRSVA
jgi:predicted RNA-binding Zn-ribbon protein involved in translation (DUF1610 family)